LTWASRVPTIAAGSVTVQPEPAKPYLSDAERALLLALARDALEAAVRRRPARAIPGDHAGRLGSPGACFVTLQAFGQLRGCIGSLEARLPLSEATCDMAAAAALRDPRFMPVSESELPHVRLSLSVLTPLERIADPAQVRVGEHGLVISRAERRGVLLPQVATENGWDRETFLDRTCVKAGLLPGAWREPGTNIDVFRAEVFGED